MVKLQHDGKKWIELEPYSKEGIYLDRKLKDKLDNIIKLRKRGFDTIFTIDGDRRTGKSTLGMTCAHYLYPKLSIGNFVSGISDALKIIQDLPDESVVIFDEGSLVFSSKDHANKEQKQLLKVVDVIGQKRMTMILIMPTFFELIRPMAVQYSRFLLHVYTDKQLNRGRVAYFGTKKKRILYTEGKKTYGSYRNPSADWIGRFTDFKPSFYDEYITLKNKSLRETLYGKNVPVISKKDYVEVSKIILKNNLKMDKPMTSYLLSTLLDIPDRTIRAYSKEIREKSALANG
ncbi:hypothetical protein LCGC14_1509130 [marine sediment metagenome]|uniref:Zona occludens toxin N-terminal domain-containing protein n=1 Tax=marine sediment metagenome TaxID=412755 RepID=A0A0F9J1Z1_9ZZZZ